MAYTDVRLEIQGGVARVSLARPEVRNALRTQTCEELAHAIAAAGSDPSVRVLVLSGDGGSFCAGADLTDVTVLQADGDRREVLRHHVDVVFQGITRAIRAFPHPTVAVISGAAVGFGFDMALACDLRVAAEDSKLGPTFSKIGLVPDGGGTHTLQRHIGPARTLEWIFHGNTKTAREVAEWGLFNRVVPAAEVATVAEALIAPIVQGPPLALAAARALVYGAQARTYEQDLAAESAQQVELLLSRDFSEGVQSFFMRRPPNFVGE